MIGKLIALVQNVRTRPPGPLSAVLGAAIAGAGIALVSRYQNHLLQVVQAAGNELDTIEKLIEQRENYAAQQRAEISRLNSKAAKMQAEGVAAVLVGAVKADAVLRDDDQAEQLDQ